MLSLMIYTGYIMHEDSDYCSKIEHPANAGYAFLLQCRHLHIPHESPKVKI